MLTGEYLFEQYVRHALSLRGGSQGYDFKSLSVFEQNNWAAMAKAVELDVRAQVVRELRSSAYLHCDVNKEDVLLCIKHGTTLIEARKLQNKIS